MQTKPRAILTPQLAREIFRLRYLNSSTKSHSVSTALASKYQVSSKTIRDIWCGRCWLEATSDLWEDSDRPQVKTKGRPKGSKDRKPRRAKSKREMTCVETEHSVNGSVQVVQDLLRKSSELHFHGINQQSKHTFKQTDQMPRMEAIALGGLKSMVPGPLSMPAQHISSFAQLPCIANILNHLEFGAPGFRVSDRVLHPSQSREIVHTLGQPVSAFQFADDCMRASMLWQHTTSSPSALFTPMPGWFPHVGAAFAAPAQRI